MRIHCGLGLFASSLVLASVANAQSYDDQHVAGLGAFRSKIDLDAATGFNSHLGVVYLNGRYYVTARDGSNTATTGEHAVFEFDGSGGLVGEIDQGNGTSSSAWGWRDGATDGANIMWGSELGIHVVDVANNAVGSVNASSGPQVLGANPIGGAGLATIGNYRAVAYDVSGNGGNGSIYTATFGSDILEVDLAGNVLATLTNDITDNWSLYGLALDPLTGRLYGNSIPNGGRIGEIDPATGDATGVTFARGIAGSAQGGLSLGSGPSSLVGVDQDGSDTMTEYRLHQYLAPFVPGSDESRLLTGVNTSGAVGDVRFKTYTGGDVIEFGLTIPGGAGPFVPGFIAFNFGPSATTLGSSPLLPSEFVAQSSISTPAGFVIWQPVIAGSLASAVVPANFQPNGESARAQGLYIHPGIGFTATNQHYFEYQDPAVVSVSAEGANSFNSDTTSGFFQVMHAGTVADIVGVEFDWAGSSVPAQAASMVFDIDQGGMADQPDGGNSAAAGCQGTYRNGSDVATGLVYPGTVASSCDATAQAGFISAGGVGVSTPTVSWSFNGSFTGQTFEWDCDTDGGAGIAGGEMAGMVVTITLSDGTVYTGELSAVSPARSEINFF